MEKDDKPGNEPNKALEIARRAARLDLGVSSIVRALEEGNIKSSLAALDRASDNPTIAQLAVIPPSEGQPVTQAKDQLVTIDSPASLGRLVRRFRLAEKLTQQEFADLAGVGRRFVSELENGKDTLEFGKVIKVARAAGLTLAAGRL